MVFSTDRYFIPYSIGEEDYLIGIKSVTIDQEIESRRIYLDDYEIGEVRVDDGKDYPEVKYPRDIIQIIETDPDFGQKVYDREMEYQMELRVESVLAMREDDR